LEEPPVRIRSLLMPKARLFSFAKQQSKQVETILPKAVEEIGKYTDLFSIDVYDERDLGGMAQELRERIRKAGQTWGEIEILIQYYTDDSMRGEIHRRIASYILPGYSEMQEALQNELGKQITAIIEVPLSVSHAFPLWHSTPSGNSTLTL